MQSMSSGGRGFMLRALLASLDGVSPEEFVEQELRRMKCGFCRDGIPRDPDGQHHILGVSIPCGAAQLCVHRDPPTAVGERGDNQSVQSPKQSPQPGTAGR